MRAERSGWAAFVGGVGGVGVVGGFGDGGLGWMRARDFNREVEEAEEVLRRVRDERRSFIAFGSFDDKQERQRTPLDRLS
jgi:hypothetical protein